MAMYAIINTIATSICFHPRVSRNSVAISRTTSPAAHRRLVGRRPVLEELPAAKVLPVRVLAPVVQHVLVAHREHVLQERQPRHHPDRNGRTTFVAAVGGFKRLLEPFPVYSVRQGRVRDPSRRGR